VLLEEPSKFNRGISALIFFSVRFIGIVAQEYDIEVAEADLLTLSLVALERLEKAPTAIEGPISRGNHGSDAVLIIEGKAIYGGVADAMPSSLRFVGQMGSGVGENLAIDGPNDEADLHICSG
jgi:hypothetical protein